MFEIRTNPSYQRSFIQPCKLTTSIGTYLAINSLGYKESESAVSSCSSKSNVVSEKTVLVFPNMEYNVVYYDAELGSIKSLTGLVLSVCEESIKFKYSTKDNSSSSNSSGCCTIACGLDPSHCATCNCNINNSSSNNKSNQSPMPTCECILNPPDNSKYDDMVTTFIPVHNIISISYKTSYNPNNCGNKKPEEEVRVMILGISATTVRAIVIHLEFFDDCLEDAVKYVDLGVGGIYDIAYECPNSHTIYEVRGKLAQIEEYYTDNPCKPGKGFVRQTTCMNNSVCNNYPSSKQDFMESPPAKQVKLIFDTSEDFSGRYETIMLSSIRDCKQVRAPIDDIGSGEGCDRDEHYCHNCEHQTCGCNIHTCGHYNACKTYHIGKYCVHINGDKVTVNSDTMTDEISMKDLLKFYLGMG